nr:DnaD domain protein [Nanoarchaeota archaeon]
MDPLRTWKDYLEYRTLLNYVNHLINYYEKHKESVHDSISDIQISKRELLKTKYKAPNGPNKAKISIDNATDQQINLAFRNSFSKKNVSMPAYLKTITRRWYESRIKNYEDRIRDANISTSLSDLIASEQLAQRENDSERVEELHQNIEQRLSSCISEELKEIWDTHKPHIHILEKYTAFKPQFS